MTSHSREIEQKYELADGVELPSFEGLDGVAGVTAPVEHHLQATYYDTVDQRLAASGLALRRRRGGDDEGWHLKESVAADERLETHAPLGRIRDGVPEALAGLVRSRTRHRTLVPIATLHSRRIVRRLVGADGAVLAEVADDTVTATARGRSEPGVSVWREVEVELVDGNRDVLAAAAGRLADAGATPASWGSKLGRALGRAGAARKEAAALHAGSSAGDVVTAHLAAQVQALVSLDPLVRQDRPDAVHKMRVAIRRLRSALATFRRLLDRSVTDPIRDELKWLAGILGAARDSEVIHARLHELVAAEPPALVHGPVARRVDDTMWVRSEYAHREVLADLDGDRYLGLLDALDDVADGHVIADDRAGRTGRRGLPKEVRRALERWRREVASLAAAEADPGTDAGTIDVHLHDVRKAAKRVRYAAEVVAPVIGRPAARLAERMEELQEVLGRHQDGIVTGRVIADLADDARTAREDTFTYGRLHAIEQRRAEAAADDGRTRIDELARKTPGWLR